jgi:hypothetical protein
LKTPWLSPDVKARDLSSDVADDADKSDNAAIMFLAIIALFVGSHGDNSDAVIASRACGVAIHVWTAPSLQGLVRRFLGQIACYHVSDLLMQR